MSLRRPNRSSRVVSAEETLGHPPAGTGAPTNLREWAYWRPEVEELPGNDGDDGGGVGGGVGGEDLYRFMASPPPGREPFAVNPSTIDKAPLLFHHLLDLADSMESHGLAAHAAAPLAVCELVVRLCLDPSNKVSGSAREEKGVTEAGGPPPAGAPVAASSKAGKGDGGGVEGESDAGGGKEEASRSPALALACLRRSRLLLKLGPT